MADQTKPSGPSRRDVLTGVGLAGIFFVLLLLTLDIGFPRDESFYFTAAEQYSYWFDDLLEDPAKAFEKKTVDRRFASNPEHPALPKILFGLSWRLFGNMRDPVEEPFARHWYDGGRPPKPILGILSESTAMRLPALLAGAFLVFLVYLFGVEFFNRRVGLAAALAWMFIPHAFWHTHLACFDMPVTAMWFLTGYCFLKAERGGWKWAVLTGLAFGFALSTKHNTYFLPPLLLVYYFVTRWRRFGLGRTPDGERTGIRLPPIPLAFPAMLILSPLVYYLFWPKLWFEPYEHLKWYIGRHANHEYYWAYYFGILHTRPPFPVTFPFVMSAMTIPLPTVLLFLVGLGRIGWVRTAGFIGRQVRRLPERQAHVIGFVLLNFLVPFVVIAVPSVPIFGGTKHWIHGVPYLALIAGLGFELVYLAVGDLGRWLPSLGGRWAQGALVAIVSLAFLVPAAVDTLHGHTNGSTYYNAAFGGYGAMGNHRMQREFWGNSAFSALDYLNEEAHQGAHVDFHDTTWDAVRMYRREGKLRKDLVPVWDYKRADFFLFHWHKEFLDLEREVMEEYGATTPSFVVAQDGVPLLNVYRRSSPVDRRGKTDDALRRLGTGNEPGPVKRGTGKGGSER